MNWMTGCLLRKLPTTVFLKHFETKNLKGSGVQHLKLGVVASGAILYYLDQTQHTHISHITSLSRIEEDRYVRLDKFTVRSLELVSTMNEEGTSLLDVLDKDYHSRWGRVCCAVDAVSLEGCETDP